MHAEVEHVLEAVRPAVRAHGGEINVLEADAESGLVRLAFVGACGNCALAPLTLRLGVEPLLKRELPWVKTVIAE